MLLRRRAYSLKHIRFKRDGGVPSGPSFDFWGSHQVYLHVPCRGPRDKDSLDKFLCITELSGAVIWRVMFKPFFTYFRNRRGHTGGLSNVAFLNVHVRFYHG